MEIIEENIIYIKVFSIPFTNQTKLNHEILCIFSFKIFTFKSTNLKKRIHHVHKMF